MIKVVVFLNLVTIRTFNISLHRIKNLAKKSLTSAHVAALTKNKFAGKQFLHRCFKE